VAIIFGVAQMSLGLVLSLLNHIHNRDMRSIWFGFVPEMTFFLSIFGYLVFMIFAKWSIDFPANEMRPPSLLNTLIAMFMSPGTYTEEDRLFAGQEHVQLGLLRVALIAVPMLLIPKPLLIYLDLRKRRQYQSVPEVGASGLAVEMAPADAEAEGGGEEAEEEHEEEHDFGEVVVHQVIHTIEFVLGSISNTASYLRLWALSLAHSQLSELFWTKVMVEQGFGSRLGAPWDGLVLFVCTTTWVVLHLGVIMVMENLSSFLHALRLQWVEFQNKFYIGDGKKFTPFSYSHVAEDD